MQLLPFIFIQKKMEMSSFYGKWAGGRCKLPPVGSDDSNLSDSGDTDSGEEYTGRDHGGNVYTLTCLSFGLCLLYL